MIHANHTEDDNEEQMSGVYVQGADQVWFKKSLGNFFYYLMWIKYHITQMKIFSQP